MIGKWKKRISKRIRSRLRLSKWNVETVLPPLMFFLVFIILTISFNQLLTHYIPINHALRRQNLPPIRNLLVKGIENTTEINHNHQNDMSNVENFASYLKSINLSISDVFPRAEDQARYITLTRVQALDRKIERSIGAQTSADFDIDRRRAQGMRTNLKLSEFAQISHLLHGAKVCDSKQGKQLSAAIFIITAPYHFEIRAAIRQTWGARFAAADSQFKLYFTFGTGPGNIIDIYRDNQRRIEHESAQYGDIIQWQFEDGYFRLTIKSLAILRWVAVYCGHVETVLKADADCLINYDQLLQFVRKLQNSQSSLSTNKNQIYGNLWRNALVIRSLQSKFFTAIQDYPRARYPDYIGGPWLLAGRDLPFLLLREAIHKAMPALLWEDLYVTGIVAESVMKSSSISLERRQMHGFRYDIRPEAIDSCLFRDSIIITQAVNERTLPQVWRRINAQNASSHC